MRKICINSPVFTRQDEERYHYVDTSLGGGSTEEEDVELESLVNGRRVPPVSVGRDEREAADSMLRDSLEGDYGDMGASSSNTCGIVVADPSRYEDLRVAATDRSAVPRQARGSGRCDVVSECGTSASQPRRYYLHDDVEDYEDARLERQHQRQEARRAHVPHLELSHSDDEPSNGEAAFDLEIDDGRGSHAVHHQRQRNASRGKCSRVGFRALPRDTVSTSSSLLTDSLEVAEHRPDTGGTGGNPDYERSVYANHGAHGHEEPRGSYSSANSHLSVHRTTHAGDAVHYRNLPVEDENYQGHTAVQNSSAKREQLSSYSQLSSSKAQVPRHSSDPQSQGQVLQASNVRRKPVEGPSATDFVEANRHNVNRKAQKTYGQIYSRKKGKEDTADSDRSAACRPVDSTGRERVDAGRAFDDQNSLPPRGQYEESSAASAEQLWQARSRSLAARKESAESQAGKTRRCRAAPPQNRVAGEVRANESRPVATHATSSAPHQYQPDVQQLPAASFTLPVRSEMSGGSPQKVTVDINLNVLSPRPLLNQPSTSLSIHSTGCAAQEVCQCSSRTQAFGNASARYHCPAASQPPLSNVSRPPAAPPQSTAGGPLQYTAAAFPHPHSAPQCFSSGRQQPTPRFFDAHGQVTPNQAEPQRLPVRYNYAYPQPSAMPVSDAPQHLVHPYQMQVHVCAANF